MTKKIVDLWTKPGSPIRQMVIDTGRFIRPRRFILDKFYVSQIPKWIRDRIGGPETVVGAPGFEYDGRSTLGVILPQNNAVMAPSAVHDIGYNVPSELARLKRVKAARWVIEHYENELMPLFRRWWDYVYWGHLRDVSRELPYVLNRDPRDTRLAQLLTRTPSYYVLRVVGGVFWEAS